MGTLKRFDVALFAFLSSTLLSLLIGVGWVLLSSGHIDLPFRPAIGMLGLGGLFTSDGPWMSRLLIAVGGAALILFACIWVGGVLAMFSHGPVGLGAGLVLFPAITFAWLTRVLPRGPF